MAYPKGKPKSAKSKALASASMLAANRNNPALREGARSRRVGYRHSEETKRKIGEAHRHKMQTDSAYRESRARHAELASRSAREKFLAALSTTALRLADVPLSKGDQATLRSLPCAKCRSRAKPRQLAHIVARSQGGPQLHVWGNVIPLCEDCHAATDHCQETNVPE